MSTGITIPLDHCLDNGQELKHYTKQIGKDVNYQTDMIQMAVSLLTAY